MAGLTETVNDINYEILTTSVDLDTSIPVIDTLTGYTISQELLSGILTLADGSVTTIAAGDTAALTALGVTIVIDQTAGTALLRVN